MQASKYLQAALLCGASLIVPAQAQQNPGPRILKIDVRVEGSEGWQHAGSYEKATISEHFFLVTTLQSGEGLDVMNVLDPDSVQKEQDKSLRQVAEGKKIEARNKALAATNKPNPAMEQQVNQAIMQAYTKCKGDENCIKAAVMQSNPGLLTPPPGATMTPGAQNLPAAQEEEGKAIYRQWFGYEGCPGKFKAMRNDTSTGAIADVGGARPRTREIKFDVAQAKPSLCISYPRAVVNEEAGKLFLQEFAFPSVPAKQNVTGAPSNQENAVTVPPEIVAWMSKTLKGVPVSGTKSETISLRKPIIVFPQENSYRGSVKITATWSFTEDYKPSMALPDN